MLPAERRLVKRRDWQRVYRIGRAVASREIVLKSAINNLKSFRFGFSVSLKVDKRATRRNLLKRRLRAIIRQGAPHIRTGYDIILIAKPGAGQLDFTGLQSTVEQLLARAKLLI